MLTRRTLLMTAPALLTLPTVLRAGGHGRLGTFTGESDHVTSGGVEVTGNTINLLDDFFFDGAPDPQVALGHDGYDASTLMGLLQSNTGAQSYEIPAGINADDYNEVWIWCVRFNVPLGVAHLN